MDREEKKQAYHDMLFKASTPLRMIAMGSVTSLLGSVAIGVFIDPWMGATGFLLGWNLKGWAFRKMALETGYECPKCGGAIIK